MVSKHWYILILLTGFVLSCHKESSVHVIDAKVQPYLDEFLYEGEIRGVVLSIDEVGLEARIETVLSSTSNGGKILGYCEMAKNNNHTVVFDAGYWTNATDQEKEILVFHELGHCLLGRDHDDSTNSDGTCISIMHSGTGSCRFIYNTSTRTGYLDELFNQ